jgi:CheY-like chemotaxis protein
MTKVDVRNQLMLHTIFICDDDQDDRQFFVDAVQSVYPTIKIEEVTNGSELLNLLLHVRPDLVFLDLDMPVLNGVQCIDQIRKNPKLKELPIVVFSSTSRISNIDTAYEVGADLFFIKPTTFGELTAAIKAILELDWHYPEKIKEQYHINGRYVPFT